MHEDREMEELLRRALGKPLPLPEGFAEKVAAATQKGRPRQRRTDWQRAAAAVFLLALSLGAGESYHLVRLHHAEAEQVAAQVTLAVEIAQAALEDSESEAHMQVRAALQTAQQTDTRKVER